jgi:hypothetical protein
MCRAVIIPPHREHPRLTAYLAILDVTLLRAATGIHHDFDFTPAIRTHHFGPRLGNAIAKREGLIERIEGIGTGINHGCFSGRGFFDFRRRKGLCA